MGRMGNAQARQRIKARDFDYLAKFTGFANEELVEEYFDTLMDKYPDGKMSIEDFIDTFKIAFPERPEDKIQKLATKDDRISMANMLILFYMFCGGNLKENLVGIFNLFDADGNKVITLNELYEIMAVFIEIGEGKDHKVDLAKTMAEMFQKADMNKDDVMDLKEFKRGMMEHPVTSKIFQIKKIDAILELM